MGLLWHGIEAGLTSTAKDPGQAAGDAVMTLAVKRTIDTRHENLLDIVNHHAALADMITWLLTENGPWQRPEPIMVGKHLWTPNAFLNPSGGLRRVVLVDRWTQGPPDDPWVEGRAAQERWDWKTLEGEIYGMPMTLIVVVLGASRDGFRHGPLSRGFLHPRNHGLRFVKSDGTSFSGEWETIRRERWTGEREEWLSVMVDDGILGEYVFTRNVPSVKNLSIRSIAENALTQSADVAKEFQPQLSRCFDPIRNCPFQSGCPYGHDPSPDRGFIHLLPPSAL